MFLRWKVDHFTSAQIGWPGLRNFEPIFNGINQFKDNFKYVKSPIWLGTVDKVRTALLSLNEDIFIPELNY